MILHWNWEEIQALRAGAASILQDTRSGDWGSVAAPSETSALVEQLLPRLTGDLSIETLGELRGIRQSVAAICEHLRARLETRVIENHPGHEEAINNYFDYAHTLSVLHRLDAMEVQFTALIELMTGAPPTAETEWSITFSE